MAETYAEPEMPGDREDGEPLERSALEMLELAAARPNLVPELDKSLLSQIGARVIDQFTIDHGSRADWEQEARLAMDAVLQKPEPKNYPFEGASNVKFPVLTNAVLQFGARTYPAIIPGDRIVKVKVVGPDPHGLKAARGDRVAMHMSHQLRKDMPWWEQDTDTLCHQLPVMGHAFRKVYHDPETNRPCSHLVSAMHVVVNQGTRDLASVPRITHVIDDIYPHQIEERIRAGIFAEFEYGSSGSPSPIPAVGRSDPGFSPTDADAPHVFLEQHRYEDLDGDGLREPWIITVHKDSGTVVRVVSGHDLRRAVIRDDGVIVRLPRRAYFVGFPFLPDPNGGYYGIGFGRLLRPLGEAANTTLNQIIDAAHLQNAGGGFIGSGLNVKKATMRVEMNRWTTVNAPGQVIRDAIVPHQFAGPSPVLFNVLGMLLDAAKGIASVQDVMTGEAKAQTMQPTTLLALIEQGLKVYTSIMKRLFRSLAAEYQLIYDCNRDYPDEEAYARVIDWTPPPALVEAMQAFQEAQQMYPQAAAEAQATGQPVPPPPQMPFKPEMLQHMQQPSMATDYESETLDIVPLADPSQVTDVQKMAKAQLLREVATEGQDVIDRGAAYLRVLEAAQIEDASSLIKQQGPDPLMVENAQAEIAQKKAGATKDMALAEKAAVETEGQRQSIAMEHARIASGEADADSELSRETQRLQNNKTEAEMKLKERQQEQKERESAAKARGEAA